MQYNLCYGHKNALVEGNVIGPSNTNASTELYEIN